MHAGFQNIYYGKMQTVSVIVYLDCMLKWYTFYNRTGSIYIIISIGLITLNTVLITKLCLQSQGF